MEGPSVRINAEVSTDNALVVACFPSVGMVSSVVAHFLIDHLQLEFIGGVVDARLPALTLVKREFHSHLLEHTLENRNVRLTDVTK